MRSNRIHNWLPRLIYETSEIEACFYDKPLVTTNTLAHFKLIGERSNIIFDKSTELYCRIHIAETSQRMRLFTCNAKRIIVVLCAAKIKLDNRPYAPHIITDDFVANAKERGKESILIFNLDVRKSHHLIIFGAKERWFVHSTNAQGNFPVVLLS